MRYLIAFAALALCSAAAAREGRLTWYSIAELLTGTVLAWAVITC